MIKIKGIKNIEFFAKGKRGFVYTGIMRKNSKKIKVAIKQQSPTTGAPGSIANEIKKLRLLNRYDIGPKLLSSGKDYFVYRFVEGKFIRKFLEDRKVTKQHMKKVLKNAFEQCYKLDSLGINKEEMSNPYKHILVGKGFKITLIDFERARETDKPSNVTQFCQYMIRNKPILGAKGFHIDKDDIIRAAKEYKKEKSAKKRRIILHSFLQQMGI